MIAMATRFTVLLETDPAPELTNQVRQALRHLGPCEVFMVADTTDELHDVISEEQAVEDGEEPELDPETCPACGQVIDDDSDLEEDGEDAEESEGELDE